MKKLFLLLLGTMAFAGTNNLPVEVGPVVQLQHINKFQTALVGDLVPRNSLGTPGDTVGDLGTTTYRWKNLYTKAVTLQETLTGNAVTLTEPSGIPYPINLTLWNRLPFGASNVTISAGGTLGFGGPVASQAAISGGSGNTGSTLATAPPSNGTLGTVFTFLSGVPLTTFGRPVTLQLTSNTSLFDTFTVAAGNGIGGAISTVAAGHAAVLFYVDGIPAAYLPFGAPAGVDVEPCSAFSYTVSGLSAGAHTFSVALASVDGIGATVGDCKLAAYEI